jgi:hypothetical protein
VASAASEGGLLLFFFVVCCFEVDASLSLATEECAMTNDPEPASSARQRRWSVGRMVSTFLGICRNTLLVVWLVAVLISLSLSAAAWAAYATWRVAQLTYQVGQMAYQHRREMARAIAKARVRRLTTAIPFVGAAAAVYFERQSYQEWRELYPDGTAEDYACDMAALTGEVIDEVLQELPVATRPSERLVRGFLPKCADG